MNCYFTSIQETNMLNPESLTISVNLGVTGKFHNLNFNEKLKLSGGFCITFGHEFFACYWRNRLKGSRAQILNFNRISSRKAFSIIFFQNVEKYFCHSVVNF